jgi:hypothetical protein
MSNCDDDDDDGVMYRLEGSSETQKGGLVIMKKSTVSSNDTQHEFKPPSVQKSLLGLDRLAAIKRAENEQSQEKSSGEKKEKTELMRQNER